MRAESVMTATLAAELVAAVLAQDGPHEALRAVAHIRKTLRVRLSLAVARNRIACEMYVASPAEWLTKNTGTGRPEWDTLLAAVVAHEHERAGLVPPGWSIGQRLWFDWVIENDRADGDAAIRAATPRWLADRRIFIAGGVPVGAQQRSG